MEQAMIASSDNDYSSGQPETCRENPTNDNSLSKVL